MTYARAQVYILRIDPEIAVNCEPDHSANCEAVHIYRATLSDYVEAFAVW